MTSAKELAELAMSLSAEHIQNLRATLLEAADGDHDEVAKAAEIVRAKGTGTSHRVTSVEHIAFTLLTDTFREITEATTSD